MKTKPDFLIILEEEYQKSRLTNPRFSVRAFARKLQIHPATLASVMKGSRNIPKHHVLPLAERMRLTTARKNRFIRSIQSYNRGKSFLEDSLQEEHRILDNETHHVIIAEWEHYAVLSLLEIKAAWNAQLIAERLNLDPKRTEVVLQNLIMADLIREKDQCFSLSTAEKLHTSEDVPSETLKLAHENSLQFAKDHLRKVPVHLRDYSSRTIAIDPKRLPEAKTIIRRFRKEMADLLEDGEQSEVYLLGVQLLPMTQLKKDLET